MVGSLTVSTVSISLPAEAETQLRERAAAAGKDLVGFILDMVRAELAADQMPPNAERIAELHAWATSHSSSPHEADDSREGIYQGRGE